MSSTSNDPYGTGDERDRSSGSTPPPPPGGGTPSYGSAPSGGSSASGEPAYGSTPPAYGSSSYGGSSYDSPPPAYGGGDTGQSGYGYGYPKNNLGVWSLVLGLLGLVLCGLFTGIPAIIVGHKARKAVAAGEANNSGMATAGIIMGWIATILAILGLLALTFLVATGAFEYAMLDPTITGTEF